MPVLARPDLLGAMLSHLRGIPEVTALVSSAAGWKDGRTEPRISGQLQSQWNMPTRAVRLRRTGGPILGDDFTMGLWTSRVDVLCYGQDVRLAAGLLDVVLPALCVLQGNAAGFTEHGCRVGSIEPEADVFADVDPESEWPFAFLPLVVRWLGTPV